jgi:hypothetical protein
MDQVKLSEPRAPSKIEPRQIKLRAVTVCFGVLMEAPTDAILAAVMRDLLSLSCTLPANGRLQVVSPDIQRLQSSACGQLPIDFISMKLSDCELWKGYWTEKKPLPPQGVRCSTWTRIDDPRIMKIRLRKDNHSTDLPLFDIPRQLPFGQSPSTKTMPSVDWKAPSQVPSLYPWMG